MLTGMHAPRRMCTCIPRTVIASAKLIVLDVVLVLVCVLVSHLISFSLVRYAGVSSSRNLQAFPSSRSSYGTPRPYIVELRATVTRIPGMRPMNAVPTHVGGCIGSWRYTSIFSDRSVVGAP